MTGLELEQVASELTVLDRTTGEIVSVEDADTERLAEFVTNQQQLRTELGDAETVVSRELVDRLDRDAAWTLRVGDPKGSRQWEITAPSPTAGTETYPPDVLERTLLTLIMAETITPAAASKACKRQLVLTLDVPWGGDLQEIAENVKSAVGIHIAGVEVHVAKADPSVKAVASGINALRKVEGTRDALDGAMVTQAPGARRARVTLKTRGEGRGA